VPQKYVVTFKPGKEMEEKVRQLEEADARAAEAQRILKGNGSAAVNVPGSG
jgi:hypothetical protein